MLSIATLAVALLYLTTSEEATSAFGIGKLQRVIRGEQNMAERLNWQ
jgi:hypothetical protein